MIKICSVLQDTELNYVLVCTLSTNNMVSTETNSKSTLLVIVSSTDTYTTPSHQAMLPDEVIEPQNQLNEALLLKLI